MHLSSSISTRLEYQHKTMLELVEGLTDEQIRRQVNPGKWSIFENVVHLATYQHTFIKRVDMMIFEEQPAFPRYVAEGDPLFHDNCSRPTREIIVDLISTRKSLASKLNGLSGPQLKKKGLHPAYGDMSVSQWTEFFLLHEAYHLFNIFKQAAELKKMGES